jgi:hypothetical protein
MDTQSISRSPKPKHNIAASECLDLSTVDDFLTNYSHDTTVRSEHGLVHNRLHDGYGCDPRELLCGSLILENA